MTIGDDLTRLDAGRLQLYVWLYPALGPWVRAAACDEQHRPNVFVYAMPHRPERLLALVNWDDEAREVGIENLTGFGNLSGFEAEEYHRMDTLTGESLGRQPSAAALRRRLAPHSTQIVRLTPAAAHPQLIGTSLHIAGGLVEIQAETWDAAGAVLSLVLRSEGERQGKLLVAVPAGWRLAAPELEVRDGIVEIPLELAHRQTRVLNLCFDRQKPLGS